MSRATTALASKYRAAIDRLVDGVIPRVPLDARRRFGALGVTGAVVGVGALGTAAELHAETEPVSLFANFVSSLGWGPNGSHEAFKFGLTAVGLSLVPYVLYLIASLRHTAREGDPARGELVDALTSRAVACWLPAVVGLLALAWFIDIRTGSFLAALATLGVHFAGAVVYFVGSLLGTLYLTRAMALLGQPHRVQRAVVAFMAFCALGMALAVVPMGVRVLEAGLLDPLLERGFAPGLSGPERVAFLARVTSTSPLMPFFEWMVVLGTLAWFAVTGAQTFVGAARRAPAGGSVRDGAERAS